jgi:hypothetical protein
VGNIPMQKESVNAFHARAAMHCWPDLQWTAQEKLDNITFTVVSLPYIGL